MALDLRQAVSTEHDLVVARPLVESDAPDLATLMLAAFRGTVDDEGEDIQAREEVRRTFAGAYGQMMWIHPSWSTTISLGLNCSRPP
jgi:hypothetical protein